MKKTFEVGIEFRTKDGVIIKTFHLRRGCLEIAIFDGYRFVRKWLSENYDVYKLETFAVEECFYYE